MYIQNIASIKEDDSNPYISTVIKAFSQKDIQGKFLKECICIPFFINKNEI